MKLTLNETGVLRNLIGNARCSDAEIARKLKISLQAARKIRMKLEKNNVIMRYCTKCDYSLFGLSVIAICQVKITAEAWEKFSQHEIEKWLIQPNAIKLFRVPNGELSHLVMYAFRGLDDMNKFFHSIQTKYSKYVQILKIIPITNGNVIEREELEIFNNVVNAKWENPEPLSLKK